MEVLLLKSVCASAVNTDFFPEVFVLVIITIIVVVAVIIIITT